MWAVTLAQWSPYAVHRMSVNAVQGGKTSWRQMLYDLNLPKTVIFGRKSLLDNDYTSLAEAGVSLRVVEDAQGTRWLGRILLGLLKQLWLV